MITVEEINIMSIDELNSTKAEIEKSLDHMRSEVDKVIAGDTIFHINKKIAELENSLNEKEVTTNRTAAAIVDHKANKGNIRGSIASTGNSFMTII